MLSHAYHVHMMESASPHILIDSDRLQRQIRVRGFGSVKEFADSVGVHRNTVGNYLSGKAAIPGALATILEALDLAPGEVLSLSRRRRHVPGLSVSRLITSLHQADPQAVYVLFGSRARGTEKRYSDYDIGVYQREAMGFSMYSRLLNLVADWNEGATQTAQLTDLTRADASFLTAVSGDLRFLAGSHGAWCDLLLEAGMRLYE